MKTALVIMAAGIGSRFGGGIKQLAAVGPNGEIIMDYSIHDAIEAGFVHGLTQLGWPAPTREAVRRTIGYKLEDAYTLLTGKTL